MLDGFMEDTIIDLRYFFYLLIIYRSQNVDTIIDRSSKINKLLKCGYGALKTEGMRKNMASYESQN